MKFLAGLVFMSSLSALAVEARYFRAWQGFKKASLSQVAFMSALPSFMNETVDLYRGHGILSSYIVIIPPANKPSFVPDEFALVALESREGYQAVRATLAGQNYSARHWDVFNRDNSASAEMMDYSSIRPVTLENNKAYDVMGTPIDWSHGHTTVFIGTRKTNVDRESFLRALSGHLAITKNAFGNKGLNGYIAVANQDYEIAFMNWDSRQAMELAGQTVAGQVAFADAARLMDMLMFESAQPFFNIKQADFARGYRAQAGVR